MSEGKEAEVKKTTKKTLKKSPAKKATAKKAPAKKPAPKKETNFEKRHKEKLKLKLDINTKYKREVFISGRDRNKMGTQRFSTGSFWLDYALGGGIPANRATGLWGEESTSKTTIALKGCADAQKREKGTYKYIDTEDLMEKNYKLHEETGIWVHEKSGEIVEPFSVAFVDLEGTFDDDWFETLGGKPDLIEYIMPDYGEQAVDIIQALISKKAVDVIVIDSLAALVPIAEIEASAEDQHMGVQARLINKACRKWAADLNKYDDYTTRPTIITINQLREKIGVVFGNPETRPGGHGQKFLSSAEIRTKKGKVICADPDGKYPIWTEMRGVINKNKTAPPKIEYAFNLAVNSYDPEEAEGDKKKYPIPFKAGDILEHNDVIKYASKYEMMGKTEDDKKFFIKPLGEEAILFDRKGDMLNEWIYFNEARYTRVKTDLLKLMTGKV